MQHIYANWIPTLYPLPEVTLGRLQRDLPRLIALRHTFRNYQVLNLTQGPVVRINLVLSGLPSELRVESSGLFTATADVDGVLDAGVATEFGEHARECYEAIGELWHVHMFDHRLQFFSINATYSSAPTRDEVIETLDGRYFNELLRLQQEFATLRLSFLRAARESAEDLINPIAVVPLLAAVSRRTIPVPSFSFTKLFGYFGLLLKLLERVRFQSKFEVFFNVLRLEH